MDRQLPSRNQGYVTVEYAIVTGAIIVALITPIPGVGGASVVDLVMGAIREFQAHSTTMLALP